MDAADQRWRAGRQVYIERARSGARDDPVLAQGDLLDVSGPGQRRHHELTLTGGIGRGLCPARAAAQRFLAGCAPYVMHHQLMPCFLEVGDHVVAHHAQTDKPDAHPQPSCSRMLSLCDGRLRPSRLKGVPGSVENRRSLTSVSQPRLV